MNKAYNFFLSLSWMDNQKNHYPFFSKEYIYSTPLKWIKHLVLVNVGLRDYDELTDEITRYIEPENSFDLIKQKCQKILKEYENNSILIVLKMIFIDKTNALPNFHLTKYNQIDDVMRAIEIEYAKINEIWMCKSNISLQNQNLGGRVSFSIDDTFKPTVLEIIWNTSPRLIDQYNSTSTPYLLAYKFPGSINYNIVKKVNGPDKNHFGESRYFTDDLNFVISSIYSYEEKINIFIDLLSAHNISELILEFKIDNGKFKFIDWDTNII